MIDYQTELNSEQLRVVQEGDGPCLVLAGAGTGKTRTIVYRVAYLLEKGVAPNNILLVTFTNKASKEMLRRIELLLNAQPKGLWGGTFHHVGNALLRRHGRQLGVSPDFNILDQDDSRHLIASLIAEMGFSRKGDKNFFPKAEVLSSLISFAINSHLPLRDVIESRLASFQDKADQIQSVATAYEQRKRQNNLVDFDDLLSLWLRMLLEIPHVGERLRQQFQYILIDEYQDTNRLQGLIVEELGRSHQNIFVVGDDAQSIYGFRAATVENILNFPKVFPAAKIFELKENYRSVTPILELANSSIKHNWNQFEKHLVSKRLHGQKPEVWGLADQEEEARFITNHILDTLEDGQSLNESAVLFRAAYQAMQVELELQKRGIPYIMRGGVRFFEQAHIKDIIAYLRVLHNPADEIAWQRILKLEDGIGEKNATLVSQVLSRRSTPEVELGLSKSIQGAFTKVTNRVEWLKKSMASNQDSKLKIADWIIHLIDDFYADYCAAAYEDSRERIEDLRQLAEFSRHYQDLPSFLSDATLTEGFKGERNAAIASNDQNKEYLILSTIHQAKGLEWKNVFLVGLTEGQFPHYKSWTDRKELEEERRLFYVAATRAKDHLYLTYPIASMNSIHRPSIFLQELNPDLFESFEDNEKIIEIE